MDEDPVTGSAHTTSTPFWAARLGKTTLEAIQCSARRGYLRCTLQGDRVLLAGQGKLYLEGKFFL
jgi:predicted PhzF superfamily epimerase YddE/YHI9